MRYGSGRPVRLYYTTPQVCESLEIDSSLLLQIEKNFPAIVVNKNRAGKKIFRHRDYLLIELTATCLKSGSSTEEIQSLLALAPDRGLDQWVEEQLNAFQSQELEVETTPEDSVAIEDEDPLLRLQIPMDFGESQRDSTPRDLNTSGATPSQESHRPSAPKAIEIPAKSRKAPSSGSEIPKPNTGYPLDKIQSAKRELEEILKILRP